MHSTSFWKVLLCSLRVRFAFCPRGSSVSLQLPGICSAYCEIQQGEKPLFQINFLTAVRCPGAQETLQECSFLKQKRKITSSFCWKQGHLSGLCSHFILHWHSTLAVVTYVIFECQLVPLLTLKWLSASRRYEAKRSPSREKCSIRSLPELRTAHPGPDSKSPGESGNLSKDFHALLVRPWPIHA